MSAQAARGRTTAAARRGAAGARRPAAFAPLAFGKREEVAAPERIALFTVDGTEYTIPAVIPTGDALMYLSMVSRFENDAQRGMYLIRELAGVEALTALLGESDMKVGDWQTLIKILVDHVFGQLEAPGN